MEAPKEPGRQLPNYAPDHRLGGYVSLAGRALDGDESLNILLTSQLLIEAIA